jgi:predicted kinase
VESTALVLLSGLPGCGKTTLARKIAESLHIPLFAKDRIQSTLRTLELADRTTADGYHLLLDLADEQLSLGVSAILDAVFPMEGFRQTARALAGRYQAEFRAISDEAIWRERMRQRHHYLPNWTPVDWARSRGCAISSNRGTTGRSFASTPQTTWRRICLWPSL